MDHPGTYQNGSVATDGSSSVLESELSNMPHTTMDYLDSMEQLQIQTTETAAKDPADLISEDDKVMKGNSIDTGMEDSGKVLDTTEVLMESVESNENDTPSSMDKITSVLLCRLCSLPCLEAPPVFLFRHPPHHPEVLPKEAIISQEDEELGDILSMIKATLPIKVSP